MSIPPFTKSVHFSVRSVTLSPQQRFPHVRVKRLVTAVLLGVGALWLMSCGGGQSTSSSSSAGLTASASPAASASTMNAFRAGDCVAQPTGSPTAPLGDKFQVVVRVPVGWTQKPPSPSETDLLILNAPSSYSNQPTRLQILSLLGYYQTETVDQLAQQYYGPSVHATVPSVQLVGAVTHCTVAGEAAAFFQYRQGNRSGYLVLFLHFHYLYGLRLEGDGGLDPQAVGNAKMILGSWQWTVTTPPSR